ncbi:MAG: type IV pilin [Methanomicrobiales archaeon]|nr:type IV pilin [Methanomicrobiales archaeon]
MREHRFADNAVSEVVGEMLMIGLVILLVSAFAAALGTFAPAARDPSVTILMTHDPAGNVTLWHKGGDWLKAGDLKVIAGNDSYRNVCSSGNTCFVLVPKKEVFDLGSNITIITGMDFSGDETISLVTPRAQVFSGAVNHEG